jgi:hypothetical protein
MADLRFEIGVYVFLEPVAVVLCGFIAPAGEPSL